jgi:hypothetical protein
VWTPADIDWSITRQPRRPWHWLAKADAEDAAISRFSIRHSHASKAEAGLRADHPALSEGRSIFVRSVVDADRAPRVLISGHNSPKIGKVVRKGPWRGFPVFTLTLEERATCPTDCELWAGCYGNAMPFARRHRPGPALLEALETELRGKARQHPGGFAVRLHVLGDFYSLDYVKAWLGWMDDLPALHVWGYTAHHYNSVIGRGLDAANYLWPERWNIRFSGSANASAERAVTTIWRQPEAAVVLEGIVCPMQRQQTTACVTCGLCWAPAAASKRIVFVGHGMRKRK